MPEITCFDCNGTGKPVNDPQLQLFDPYCRRCRGDGTIKTLNGRERVLQAYLEDGSFDIRWAKDYAERGYELGEDAKGILFANWNSSYARQCRGCKALADDLVHTDRSLYTCPKSARPDGSHEFYYYDDPEDRTMPRLEEIAERAGYAVEWSDEWSFCEDCNKAFRTQADSHGWRPSYVEMSDCVWICLGCVEKDPDGYLGQFVGTTKRMKAGIDLEKCGYELVGIDWSSFGGQSDSAAAMRLKRIGVEDFIFVGEDQDPSIYVRGREIVRGTYLEKMELEWTVKRAEKALEENAFGSGGRDQDVDWSGGSR